MGGLTAAARVVALPFFVGIGRETGRRSATERYAGVAAGGKFGAGAKLGVGARIDENGWEREEEGSDDWSGPCERGEVDVGSAALGGSVGSWARRRLSWIRRRVRSAAVSAGVSASGAIGVVRRWEVARVTTSGLDWTARGGTGSRSERGGAELRSAGGTIGGEGRFGWYIWRCASW